MTSTYDLRTTPVRHTTYTVTERLIEVGSPHRTLILTDTSTDTIVAVSYIDDPSGYGREVTAMLRREMAA